MRKPFWDEGTSMIRKPTWENPYDNSDQIGISWLHPWKNWQIWTPKNGGLVQMIFFFNWVIFRFQNFSGVSCLGSVFFVPHEPSPILERCLGFYFWNIFTTHKLGERWSYGWWFRNPANQLRLVVEIYIACGMPWNFWTINNMMLTTCFFKWVASTTKPELWFQLTLR